MPKMGWLDDNPLLPHLVIWPNEEPDYSGLLDKEGYPFIRPREPIGFIDWSARDPRRHRDSNKPGLDERS